MEPFTWAVLGDLLIKFGPLAIDYASKIAANISAGKANVVPTAADYAELDRLKSETAADIYARLGIAMPVVPSPADVVAAAAAAAAIAAPAAAAAAAVVAAAAAPTP